MISVLSVFLYLIILTYSIIILSYLAGWIKTKNFKVPEDTSSLKISIVVPFRNEEKNLPSLINDLLDQSYSEEDYEIILVDDHSTDNSFQLLLSYQVKNLKIISLPPHLNGKKQALDHGIRYSSYDYILTTDADCSLKREWIKTFVAFYNFCKPAKMIIGLVDYKSAPGFFSKLQNLEFLSLIGSGAGAIAIGKPLFCNGANLFFDKNVYLKLDDPLINAVASGDDTFLLHQVKKHFPQSIFLLKSRNTIVDTSSCKNLSGFFNQRLRWASKARFYKDFDSILVSITIFITNILFLLSLILLFTPAFKVYIPIILVKLTTDFIFLYFILLYFNKIRYLVLFPVAQLFYPFYIILTSLLSLNKEYNWKGRKYKI